ncbi:hypothetical protein DL767_011342 [Monosporascus sp. MG133]|nr:hypothetical protein DL767_011342 [Monosporascus sp. MG133]
MPASNRQPAPQASAQPPPKTTAKYKNKDGTKYIEVPKSSASTPPAQPSPTTTTSSRGGASASQQATSSDTPPAPHVNPKKQKRRAKAAAKAAAKQAQEAAVTGLPSPASTTSAPPPPPSEAPLKDTHHSHHDHPPQGQQRPTSHPQDSADWGDETESEDGGQRRTNGSAPNSKKSTNKKKKKRGTGAQSPHSRPSGMSKEKIWNTSGPEERERIKQFWLGLKEDERKSLVKVEKDTVLKKMKEQQKHTCSCSVCGRKRTAIEEELEGLYDAYYEELESFANQPHNHPDGPSMFGGPKRFGPMTGLHPPGAVPARYSNHHPSRGRIVEHVDNDEEEDEEDEGEEYSEDDDLDDEEDEDEEPEEVPRDSLQQDFFTFGQSLTVKGGILTVADDLLKNDGKKFIEMMEQLAERRMAREEDAKDHYAGAYGHPVNGASLPNPHNHPPPDEEEYDEEEEEEEEYDSQDEDYEEEEDTMTEEQRMEEGRRMFQIFAARMFEQRVLTAYREKVARERQDKLLEELEQENNKKAQQAAKKAKEAQKKKDRAAQKKQAQLEEKARREAQKAAEEAARREEEQKKVEEAKRKAEEKRKKKDAQRRAEEEERLRKEAERQRRALEQKEKQAEQERKAREAKERERKSKEEQRRKEQEARELKERETRERREKHEKDKREKELRAAQAKAEREAKEKQKQEEKATQKAAALVAPIPTQPAKKQHPVSVPALPQHIPGSHASPQISVATPVLPKAPTPMKPRSVSQEVPRSVSQASHSASGTSQAASPHPLTPVHASPGPICPPSKTSSTGPMSAGASLQPASPLHTTMKSPPGLPQIPFNSFGAPPMGMQFPPGLPPMAHGGFGRAHEPIFPPGPGNYRPGGIPAPPPGFGGPIGGRPFPPPSQLPPGFPFAPEPMPGMHQGFPHPESVSPGRPSPHSRQASTSFEPGSFDMKGSGGASATQPITISKPGPIGRPASVVHGQRKSDLSADIDEASGHLGSSALIDETDIPLEHPGSQSVPRHIAPGPGTGPQPLFSGPPIVDPVFGSPLNAGWGLPQGGFPPPPGFGNPWPSRASFGIPSMGARQPRSVTVRQMLVQACKDLANHAADADGYIGLSAIKGHVDSITPPGSQPVDESDLLEMCETEGNAQNGGGSFEIKRDQRDNVIIRFDPDNDSAPSRFPRSVGAPGETRSPVVSSASPVASASRF